MKNQADYSKYKCPFAHVDKECGHELKGPEGYEETYGVWCACGFRGPVLCLEPEILFPPQPHELLTEMAEAIEALPVEEWVQQDDHGDPELIGYVMQAQGEWDRVKKTLAAYKASQATPAVNVGTVGHVDHGKTLDEIEATVAYCRADYGRKYSDMADFLSKQFPKVSRFQIFAHCTKISMRPFLANYIFEHQHEG